MRGTGDLRAEKEVRKYSGNPERIVLFIPYPLKVGQLDQTRVFLRLE